MVSFSIQVQQRHLLWPELRDMVSVLDSHSGFRTAWLVDHLSVSRSAPQRTDGPILEGWASLSALAACTSRIRLGILVSSIMHRNPALLAKMATTVDNISAGRLDFGIGGGYHKEEHEAYGIDFPSTAERLRRLKEALQVVRLLWSESMPVFAGEYYSLHRPSFVPANVQAPYPPILVGGLGEGVTLRIVAEFADACNFRLLTTPEAVRRKYDLLDEYCLEYGRDPSSIRRSVEVPLVADVALPALQSAFSRFGVSKELLPNLVLSGSSDSMRRVLDGYFDQGVDEVVVYFPERVDIDLACFFHDQVASAYL